MVVKKTIAIVLLIFVCSSCLASKTTFVPRAISTNQVFELALTNHNFHHNDTRCGVVEIKPFFQRSFSGRQNASFFLPTNKDCPTIRENGTGDMGALWFNLIAAAPNYYKSSISINPRRTCGGVVLTFFSFLPCIDSNLWVGLNMAVAHAKHTLHLKECDRLYEGTLPGFQNAYEALTTPEWCAGKFYCKSLSRSGIDDIQLKIGYEAISHECSWFAPYLIGSVPTGKKIRSIHIFEPIIGSHHGSIGSGFCAGVDLWNNGISALSWMLDANYRYVFAGCERRSFDLARNGDWSRYLLVATQEAPLFSLPGINYFTQNVRVTPGSTCQLWTALHYHYCNWQAEIGYNFWFRGREKIKFRTCKPLGVGILDLSGICNLPATSSSTATIAQEIIGNNAVEKDSSFVELSASDFDIKSAENRSTITNTLYASIGHEWDCDPVGFFIGLNGSGEFTRRNNALRIYAVWAQAGLVF